MKKLSIKGQKWLKGFHILFGCMWVGAACCLSVKQFFVNPTDGMELYGVMATMNFIDIWIIIPGAVGVLLTALIYSIWTNWGWFKHNWITVKWCICIYGVIFGTYPLGPWMSEMTAIAKMKGLAALTDPTFTHNRDMLLIFGTFQFITIAVACFVSVLKPWKKKAGS
jgi:uncharacterized membrane protein